MSSLRIFSPECALACAVCPFYAFMCPVCKFFCIFCAVWFPSLQSCSKLWILHNLAYFQCQLHLHLQMYLYLQFFVQFLLGFLVLSFHQVCVVFVLYLCNFSFNLFIHFLLLLFYIFSYFFVTLFAFMCVYLLIYKDIFLNLTYFRIFCIISNFFVYFLCTFVF